MEAALVLRLWLALRNTEYTFSTLLNRSKNGIKSLNSVSVMSSNQEATGTYTKGNGRCVLVKSNYWVDIDSTHGIVRMEDIRGGRVVDNNHFI